MLFKNATTVSCVLPVTGHAEFDKSNELHAMNGNFDDQVIHADVKKQKGDIEHLQKTLKNWKGNIPGGAEQAFFLINNELKSPIETPGHDLYLSFIYTPTQLFGALIYKLSANGTLRTYLSHVSMPNCEAAMLALVDWVKTSQFEYNQAKKWNHFLRVCSLRNDLEGVAVGLVAYDNNGFSRLIGVDLPQDALFKLDKQLSIEEKIPYFCICTPADIEQSLVNGFAFSFSDCKKWKTAIHSNRNPAK